MGFDSELGVGLRDGVVTLPRLCAFEAEVSKLSLERQLLRGLAAPANGTTEPKQCPFRRLDGLKWARGGGICWFSIEIVL